VFLKKIASRLIPRSAAPTVRARLAAFGKHPGWNDHIDDLGLDSDLLVAAKRVIYVEGIGGNIDSGAWERLDSEHRLAGFDHLLAWRLGRDLVLARIWSSSDGKGRTRYPLIACAQLTDLPLEWSLRHAIPILERLREQCVAATSADAVRSAFGAAKAELEGQAAAAPTPEQAAADPTVRHRLGTRPELGPDALGLLRVLYQIEREMGAYRPRSAGTRTRTFDLRPQQLRIPACDPAPDRAVALWLDLFGVELDPSAPVMLIVPIGSPWLDVIVGEPSAAQLFCIRATRQTLPLTTEIPYNLDAEFLSRTRPLVGV
jgi:hypothetical protein